MKQTIPDKLRLIADIEQSIIDGKQVEWEVRRGIGTFRKPTYISARFYADLDDVEIRLKPSSFPPPPEGCQWHNPEGLTPEQVGKKFRLLISTEVDGRFKRGKNGCECWQRPNWNTSASGEYGDCSYRVPLSTPFPDGSVLQPDGTYSKPWVPKFKVGDKVRVKGNKLTVEILSLPGNKSDIYEVSGHSAAMWKENDLEPAPPATLIPLGPEDVPAGSVVRIIAHTGGFISWSLVTQVSESGICHSGAWISWETLKR